MAAERCSSRLAVALIVLLSGLLVYADHARAGSVDTNAPFTLVTGKLLGRGNAEALFVFHHEDPKLAVYLIEGETLKLLFVRDCKKDFEMKASLGKMDPKPSDVKKAIQKKKAAPPKKDASGKGEAEPVSKPEAPPVEVTGKFTLALGRPQGFGEADAIYIWSHDRKRLNVYLIRNDTLELLFSRNCTYDFEVKALGKHKPTVGELEEVDRKTD